MKTSILGTGLSGMVGTRVVELLSTEFDFIDLSYATGIDITNYDQVLSKFEKTSAETVLHMAAKTDVDGCEDEKILGEEGPAWMINVVGTENIVAAAKKTGKRVIYISTDFVFNGTKEFYTEEDEPDPINWYSITKYEGEKLVSESGLSFAIARLAYPYRAVCSLKADFVRRMLEKAKKGEKLFGLTDHVFTPTFIDDIADSLRFIFNKKIEGIYHVVGSNSLTPYKAVQQILDTFELKAEIIPVKREEFFKDRAYRPFQLALKNDKITGFGINLLEFPLGLAEMKRQMEFVNG
jgi:dTDP-4-dehydrorhamnose reductase